MPAMQQQPSAQPNPMDPFGWGQMMQQWQQAMMNMWRPQGQQPPPTQG